MSFGGFIKKRGLRIKMRNYDPYKKTILFFASLVNIVLMSLVFTMQLRCLWQLFTEKDIML